jgi:hypothetical protein
MMTTKIMVTIRHTIIIMKYKISFWRGVKPCFGVEVSFAMRPKMVRSPVSKIRPNAVPETQ